MEAWAVNDKCRRYKLSGERFLSAYLLIFVVSFGAATVLPFSSEAVLTAQLVLGEANAALLVFLASVGNVLGSCVNWWIGRYIQRYRKHKWFPVERRQLARSALLFRRYGMWTLLFAWVPVIGDPLTFAAGLMRTAFLPFVILVAIGKTARYLGLAWGIVGAIA